MTTHNLCVAYGDGIGPEIMSATLDILAAAGTKFNLHRLEMGEQVYLQGINSGIKPEDWAALRQYKLLLKAPITTPQGGGYKSLNVSLRKTLGLFANIRPCKAYAPYIKTFYPQQDLVIIRENEEDLYAGIEHQQTPQVIQCLKLISVPGCERIIRYAFNYARTHKRHKVTCVTKDNIMKLTDGLFHKIFKEISQEYPELATEHLIVDIASAHLATSPERFDVIVSLNLYGDILSDIAAQVAGSVGLAGSANIGHDFAMFEAIHGSAPDIANKNIANPSGLLHASLQMLNYLGMNSAANNIEQAWYKTISDGIHTADIANSTYTKEVVGTKEFAQAVISRLGINTTTSSDAGEHIKSAIALNLPITDRLSPLQELVGVDIFIQAQIKPEQLAQQLNSVTPPELKLALITNRGTKVWPDGYQETLCTDHWRCRFKFIASPANKDSINTLLAQLETAQLNWIKLENLYHFDGKPGYSLGQGE